MKNKFPFAFYFTFFIYLLTLSCKQTDKKNWNLYGYFGSTKYFNKDIINSEYIETFIIKIDTNFVTLYGTVQTWGKGLKYNFSSNNDTLLIEKQLKIYKKDDSTILIKYSLDESLHIEKFSSIPNLKSVIDSVGVNSEKLGQLLGNLQLVGKYKYNDQVVEFREDGRVSNFDKFNTFKIRPRLGLFSFYDNKIIETENGIWKFSNNKETLMFQKYSTKRDENEMYILSKDEAILKR